MSEADATRAGQGPPAAPTPRSRARLVVQVAASLVLVVAACCCLLTGTDLGQAWANTRVMAWLQDASVLAVAAWNLATSALAWPALAPRG